MSSEKAGRSGPRPGGPEPSGGSQSAPRSSPRTQPSSTADDEAGGVIMQPCPRSTVCTSSLYVCSCLPTMGGVRACACVRIATGCRSPCGGAPYVCCCLPTMCVHAHVRTWCPCWAPVNK